MSFRASLIAVLATATSLCEAHFAFVRLAHNGVWQPPLQYIRNRTSPWDEGPSPPGVLFQGFRLWEFPVYAFDSPDSIRCGRDHKSWANSTDVLEVNAGDTFEWAASLIRPYDWNNTKEIQWDGCPEGRGTCINGPNENYGVLHTGPTVIHISKVPEGKTLQTYDGSAEWIKISSVGVEIRKEPEDPNYWLPLNGARLTATLPKQTPAGHYFLRVDMVFPGDAHYPPQHYPACAYLDVKSEAEGKLPKGIKIPEDMDQDSFGMNFTSDYGKEGSVVLTGNRYPGGLLWDGENLVEDKIVETAD